MIAVIVNCIAVIIGSIIGLLFSRKMTDSFSDIIQTGAGVVTIVLGIQMALQYQNIVFLTLSIILGGVFGSLADIDGKILHIGSVLEKVFPQKNTSETNKNFAYAFLNASVLFCVGAMSIVGSFKAAIEKDYSIIFTKSILDGFIAITFAAAMGAGTIFSFISIFVYQGSLTILSSFLKPYVSEIMLAELTACGGVLIVMIGINLLNLRKIKTANYLPSILLEIVFVIAVPLVKSIFF